jgi:DNA-binding NtrC family response regulator
MTTVLLVDDDDDQNASLGLVLEHHYKYNVLMANSGADGVEIAKTSEVPIDVLVTDFVMPGKIRSIDLANFVKKAFPRSIIIFASGYEIDSDLIGNAFAVTKPYGCEQIHNLIINELNGLQN